MTRLNQIVAIERGVKESIGREITNTYHVIQKPDLMSGIARSYRPKDDEGDPLPSEQRQVQVKVDDILGSISGALTRLLDVTFTKDMSNTVAKADIVVDGFTLAADVPASYLLWLEKQIDDMHTLVSSLPTLDPAERWSRDEASGAWATEPAETSKTKKIPRVLVKYEATPEHPAQVDVWHEDEVVGYWSTIKYSGAVSAERKSLLVTRVRQLREAVKMARQAANEVEVIDRKIGEVLFNYVLAP